MPKPALDMQVAEREGKDWKRRKPFFNLKRFIVLRTLRGRPQRCYTLSLLICASSIR